MSNIDLNRIRNKLEILKNPKLRTTKFEKKTWSPSKDSTKVVRFIQDPHQSDEFQELHFHYGLGYGFLCPRLTNGGSCPVCSFAFDLRKSKDPKDVQAAKTLMPKQRFYGLIIDREDPSASPKWWGFGKEIYGQLLEALLNEEYRNFMDPYEGLDAEVKVVAKAGGKSEYSAPSLTFKRKESKLASDQQSVEKILQSVTPLSEVFKPLTEVEIQERLASWMKLDEKDGEEIVKKGAQSSSSAESSSEVNYKDLDEAFEQALNDD